MTTTGSSADNQVNLTYQYLQEKYCENCQYFRDCDWVPYRCPIIRHHYGDSLDDIEGFDKQDFDPIKYYWEGEY